VLGVLACDAPCCRRSGGDDSRSSDRSTTRAASSRKGLPTNRLTIQPLTASHACLCCLSRPAQGPAAHHVGTGRFRTASSCSHLHICLHHRPSHFQGDGHAQLADRGCGHPVGRLGSVGTPQGALALSSAGVAVSRTKLFMCPLTPVYLTTSHLCALPLTQLGRGRCISREFYCVVQPGVVCTHV
jgi:hypothetical protein